MLPMTTLRTLTRTLAAALFLAAAWPGADAAAELSSSPREETWVTNGDVIAIATTPTTAYLGGNFTYVGPCTGIGVPIDAVTGSAVAVYPKLKGMMLSVAVPDGMGGWYVGGSFTRAGTATLSNIAHILSNGTVDAAWVPNANGSVYALAVSGTTVYVGGGFTNIGGQARNRIAALDAVTGLATAWNPNANGVSPSVKALAVSGSTVFAGGNFNTIGGKTRNLIAALDATTGLALDWDPGVLLLPSSVSAVAVSGTTVYVGGYFTASGGQSRNNIAALDAATGLATDWNPNANGDVDALAVSGTTVYAGGKFTTIGGQTRNRIAALDAATGLATDWNPDADNTVYDLDISGATVYVSGDFTTIGGQARNYIAALDADTGLATGWNPSVSSRVLALAISGGIVYSGGLFTSVGGQTRNYIAALNRSTGEPTDWNPNASGSVLALGVSGTTVYIGGWFTGIGGQARNCIAAVDSATGLATDWNPDAGGTYPFVNTLAFSGTTIYASGDFTSIGGRTRNYIAALNTVTGLATDWDPNSNDSVYAVAVSDTAVYTGGKFTSIGGQSRNRVAALDTVTGLATDWNPDASDTVYAIDFSGPTVYAGGVFTSIGGQSRNRIAALDAVTGSATAWNPNANNYVTALAVSGATIYAGGWFHTIGGKTRNHTAALDAATGLVTDWNPSVGNSVDLLAVSGRTVYAGGQFTSIGEQPRSYFAEFRDPIPIAPSNPGATSVDTNTVTWTWQDDSDDEMGFKVWDDPGAGAPTTLQTTTAADVPSWTHTGLTPNAQYTFQVAATNAYGDSAKTTAYSIWTLALNPVAPVVNGATGNSLDVALGVGDGNPWATIYAIYCTTTGQWVQPGGALGASAAWQTASDWGATTVTGLAGYMNYAFTVTARNGANLESSAGPTASGMTLDVAPPTGTISVNSGALYTSTTDVTLTLTYDDGTGSGVTGMQFSNDNLTWSGWEAAAGTKAWALSPGDGAKTVYVQYRDAVGNVTTSTISDDITLDVTVPTAHLSINGFDPVTNDPNVALNIWGDDGTGSGIEQMRFGENNADWTPWEPMAGSRGFLLTGADGTKTVYLEVMDGAGNISAPDVSSIILDTRAPTAVITMGTVTPTASDTVAFSVVFSESVGTTYNDAAVSVAGTLSGTAVVSGTDPNYTVTVTLADPDANGTVGITVAGGMVADLTGNTYPGGSSSLCTVYNWPGFAMQPLGGKLYVGDTHPLQVQVAEGGIPTTYQWKFDNGTTVVNGPAAAQWPLTVMTVGAAGNYWCEMTFDGVPHVSSAVVIEVQPRVSITLPPVGGDAEPGKSYTFTVTAAGGYGALTYQWKKDGVNIPDSNDHQYLRANLASGDSGNYSVEVSDTNGDAIESVPVTLTVGTGMPVAGVGGLALLAASVCAAVMRRKRP